MNKIFGAMVMVTFAACLDSSMLTTDEDVVSTTVQELGTCSSSCDPPTYNGVPVSCTSNTYCVSAPEAAYCLQDDGTYYVAACAVSQCGNGACDAGETISCPSDCGPYCGDGICRRSERYSCPEDCGQWCYISCP